MLLLNKVIYSNKTNTYAHEHTWKCTLLNTHKHAHTEDSEDYLPFNFCSTHKIILILVLS